MPPPRVTMRIRVEGLRETQQALRELFPDSKARSILRRVLRERAKPIAETARGFAPVDPTGDKDLKNSIQVSGTLRKSQRGASPQDPNDVTIYVGPSTKNTLAILAYAHLQEFGSSHQSPYPYMRPAWDRHQPTVVKGIGDAIWKEIRKTAERAARKAARTAARAG